MEFNAWATMVVVVSIAVVLHNPGAAGRLEIVGGAKLQGPHGAE
jgi:hypothetical protein